VRDLPLLCTLFPILLAFPGNSEAADLRVLHDGFQDEWPPEAEIYEDPLGDGLEVDFGSLSAASDGGSHYLLFELEEELLLQQDNLLRLYLDTDLDAGTGQSYGGIGADLTWDFGDRDGTFHYDGSQTTVYHSDLDMRELPTHSSDFFELAFAAGVEPVNGHPLFPEGSMRLILRDRNGGGDRLPDDGSLLVELSDGSSLAPLDTLSLARPAGTALRLLSWNTEFGGLFDPAAEGAYERILQAAQPDLIAFQELWDYDAQEVEDRVTELLPELGPWHAVRIDGGNATVSRYPVTQSMVVAAGYRETATVIDTAPVLGVPLLLINCHLRCCGADEERQWEADALVDFLRDAREPGGRLTLDPLTPMILCGDFNLVGLRQQLVTIQTGEIVNQGVFGPSSPPDWDGGDLADLVPRQIAAPSCYTWHDDWSSYLPGRLDFVFYTDSAVEMLGSGVVWTPELPAWYLAEWGLQADDAPDAADHIPLYADFRLLAPRVENLEIGVEGGNMLLEWDSSPGALYYTVYGADFGGAWTPLAQPADTSWTTPLPPAPAGKQYRVTATY